MVTKTNRKIKYELQTFNYGNFIKKNKPAEIL
jgi:hypothetical protein